MTTEQQINRYIQSQPEPKQQDLLALQQCILRLHPNSKLWFMDGTDDTGKSVTNPNIGYGTYTFQYADGSSREFYKVGFSANTGGISLYIMGLPDKTALAKQFGDRLGKAKVTGYCIKFKSLKEVDMTVLEEAIQYGFLN